MNNFKKKVTLLAGGVGGAKMAEGLDAIKSVELSVIGNIADDENFHGLWVSPDIDTITYSLAKIINRKQGWGLSNDKYNTLSILKKLGLETWMSLGDKDFGVHIYRSFRLKKGDKRSKIAEALSKAFNLKTKIILPTDDIIQTRVLTNTGWLSFQEYFVKESCLPKVKKIFFKGIKKAKPTLKAIKSIQNADIIIFAPSNPLVSLRPIIEIPGIKKAIIMSTAKKIGISPFIGNKTVKGPASKMMIELGFNPNALGFSEQFHNVLDALIIDYKDELLIENIKKNVKNVYLSNILMLDMKNKIRLAKEVMKFSNYF